MSKREARNMQRYYQQRGYYTFTSSVIYSGREDEGFQYIVWVTGSDGKQHELIEKGDRVGGIRTTTI